MKHVIITPTMLNAAYEILRREDWPQRLIYTAVRHKYKDLWKELGNFDPTKKDDAYLLKTAFAKARDKFPAAPRVQRRIATLSVTPPAAQQIHLHFCPNCGCNLRNVRL